jgi:hypothetical protein
MSKGYQSQDVVHKLIILIIVGYGCISVEKRLRPVCFSIPVPGNLGYVGMASGTSTCIFATLFLS